MITAVIGGFLWGIASVLIFPYPLSMISAIVGGVAIGILTASYGAP
jgi:hypothetical protein